MLYAVLDHQIVVALRERTHRSVLVAGADKHEVRHLVRKLELVVMALSGVANRPVLSRTESGSGARCSDISELVGVGEAYRKSLSASHREAEDRGVVLALGNRVVIRHVVHQAEDVLDNRVVA